MTQEPADGPGLATVPGLPADLPAWVETQAGGRLVGAERIPAGGRRQAWFVDIEDPHGVREELFLRYDPADPAETGEPFTLQREARFFQALQGTDVPVPRVVGVHPRHQAILSSRVAGQTWFSRLTDPGEREAVARDFMSALAALHRVPPERLDLPGEPLESDLRVHVRREIDVWEAMYRGSGVLDPLAELGFRYLRAHVPDVAGPVVIVQGDTGPGNFLYADGGVTAVLDWELGHHGDPMDDLAWLSLRAVQEPFTDLAERMADYAALVPHPVDVDRIRYYRVFAELRVVVLGLRREARPDPRGEIGGGLVFGALHRRLLVEALSAVTGLALEPPAAVPAVPTARDWLFDAVLVQLREVVVPGSPDPFVVARCKGIARVVKYLQSADRLAAQADAAEREDLTRLLGSDVGDLAVGRSALAAALAAGSVSEQDILRYAAGASARQTQQARASMGVLAERHFDPLPGEQPVR